MKKQFFLTVLVLAFIACNPKIGEGLRRNDLKKDVEMVTTKGTIVLRLSDSTPLHRNNFLKLVKQHLAKVMFNLMKEKQGLKMFKNI